MGETRIRVIDVVFVLSSKPPELKKKKRNSTHWEGRAAVKLDLSIVFINLWLQDFTAMITREKK